MILIADSGSTKCDWRLVDGNKDYSDFKSVGINPYFHNEAFIEGELGKVDALIAHAEKVKAVFFYGAGCSSPELKRIVDNALGNVFTKAQIYVDHDLVAAAFSVYEDEPCIACILGTGSNSCHFDGDIVREEVPALAYILGDEGSGSYFGKKLLAAFLYKKLPETMREGLISEFGLNKDAIMDRVYMKPHANVYLAGFMRFITSFKHEQWVQDTIREGLGHFLDVHVMCYRDYKTVKSNFIGSVAFFHEDLLREEATKRGIRIGNIMKKPLEGLYEYHVKNYFGKIAF